MTVLRAGADYKVSFRIRSDGPREVDFCVRQEHEPCAILGLQGKLQVTETWQSVSREFTANADNSNALFTFDLGASDIPVELAEVSFRAAAPTPAHSIDR
jgi:hypothetical protein